MRVAVWHNLPSGGGKRALYDHVGALVTNGHHVESWCPPTADQSFLPLSDHVNEHVRPLPGCPPGRWRGLRDLLNDKVAAIAAMRQHCRDCATEIAQGGFDILFANSCMFFRAPPIGEMVLLPKLLYLQEPYRWLYEALPTPPWAANKRPRGWWYDPPTLAQELKRALRLRKRAIQIREEVRNAGAFDKILCNSFYSRESILRAYGLGAEVCYLGVNAARFAGQGNPDDREDFFLTVGAAIPEKNIEFIIRALGHRQDRSWPLVWVANVPNDELVGRLRILAAELDIALDVRVGIAHEELLDLYRRAGLFLYAPRLEPFGLAPLEAAAAGLAVVAVAEAGTRETVADGISGLLVTGEPRAFAAAVDTLVGNPERRARLGTQGRQVVAQRWGAADAGRRLEAALSATIEEARR